MTTLDSPRAQVGSLSGGQRQAVAIARSLVDRPRVLILDEPTAALGVVQTAQVLALIDHLREQGLAIVVISHNLDNVFHVADRISVLRLGRHVATFDRRTHVARGRGRGHHRRAAGSGGGGMTGTRRFRHVPMRVLVLGGGVAASRPASRCRRSPEIGSIVTLIAPNHYFAHRPVDVRDPLDVRGRVRVPVARLAARRRACATTACGLDRHGCARRVHRTRLPAALRRAGPRGRRDPGGRAAAS